MWRPHLQLLLRGWARRGDIYKVGELFFQRPYLIPDTENAGRQVRQDLPSTASGVADVHGSALIEVVVPRHQLRESRCQHELAPDVLIYCRQQRIVRLAPGLLRRF